MKPIQTLDEVYKYLLYIAEALYSTSRNFGVDRNDRALLEKYSDDLLQYSKGIEQLKNNMAMKEEMKKKEIEEEELQEQENIDKK